MDVHFEIPEEFARYFASDAKGLARAALEALAVSLRNGWLSEGSGVFFDLTLEDVRKDTDAALASSR